MGVLSALPIISAGNLCCCLWVISGGVVAAYVLQHNNPTAIKPADGAMVGLLAGVIGAFVYLALSIPITLIVSPMQRALVERLIESGGLPPEFREYLTSYAGGALGIALSFFSTLIAGVVFATLGGVLGAAIFGRPSSPPPPPTVIDIPPS
jgi:uncharacterized protein YqgC (DUF456 family)